MHPFPIFMCISTHRVHSNTLWKNSYHGGRVNIGCRMNIDITWGNEKCKQSYLHQYEEGTMLQKANEPYHLFWALPPYLKPVFQDVWCDTD